MSILIEIQEQLQNFECFAAVPFLLKLDEPIIRSAYFFFDQESLRVTVRLKTLRSAVES